MANVTIANIGGGEDTAPANTAKVEIEVGGVSKFAQLVNILKGGVPAIATDTIWDAAGDLVQGTGANTAARLAKGGALALPRMNVGATAIEWGTGGQIAFPATAVPSADANTLDDYEEGTWTPSVGGNATYTSTPNGRYTKTGDIAYVEWVIAINAIGTGSTTVVSGLPFASASGSIKGLSVGSFYLAATALTSVILQIASSVQTITVNGLTAAATTESAASFFQNGTQLQASGCYKV